MITPASWNINKVWNWNLQPSTQKQKTTNWDLVLPDTDSAPSLAFRTVENPENSEQSLRVRTERELDQSAN